jgi:fibrillarin-like rRNA methylase
MYFLGVHPETGKSWRFRDGKPVYAEEMEEVYRFWRERREKMAAEILNREPLGPR